MKSEHIKWFFIAYFALLILVLTVVGIFGQLGYMVIDMGMVCLLFGILICSALIGATVLLVKRLNGKGASTLVGCVGAILTFIVATVLVMVSNMLLTFGMPAHFTTVTSPSGKDAVIVREISTDTSLQQLRRSIESDAELNMDRLGYSYSVHPRFLHFFYNTKVQGEGSLEIGVVSKAVLMQQWPEDDTLRLFIQDPEPGDVGELTLTLK